MMGTFAFVAIIVAIVLVSLLGLTLVRRAVPRDRLAQHTDVAGYVYAVIGVIYAVILAQVVIAAWEEYRDARNDAASEAYSVLNLNRLSRSWSDPARSEVLAALVAYARHVVDVEFPDMAAGDYRQAVSTDALDALWSAYDRAGQGAAGASANYAASLDELDELDEARRARLLLAENGLPQAMIITLIVGAIVTVGFSYLFAVESGWVHGVMTASLATLIGLLLLLEFELETPFQGVAAIEPTAMVMVLQEIDPGGA